MGNMSFNGKSIKDLGYVVQTEPAQNFPAKDVTTTHVAGRNGDFVIDSGSYANVEREYSLGIPFQRGVDFSETVTGLVTWLQSAKGYARLEDTYDPNVFRLAKFSSAGSLTNISNQATTFSVKFDCKPQRYLKSGEKVFTSNAGNSIDIINNTIYSSKPIISVSGLSKFSSFDVVMLETKSSDKTESISIESNNSDLMILDSELQTAYNEETDLNDKISLNGNTFPELKPGNNTVSVKAFRKHTVMVTSFDNRISEVEEVCRSEFLPHDMLLASMAKSYDVPSYNKIVSDKTLSYPMAAFNSHLLDISQKYDAPSINEALDGAADDAFVYAGTYEDNAEHMPDWLAYGGQWAVIDTTLNTVGISDDHNWRKEETDKLNEYAYNFANYMFKPGTVEEFNHNPPLSPSTKENRRKFMWAARGYYVTKSGWYRIKSSKLTTSIMYIRSGWVIFDPKSADWDPTLELTIYRYSFLGNSDNIDTKEFNQILGDERPGWLDLSFDVKPTDSLIKSVHKNFGVGLYHKLKDSAINQDGSIKYDDLLDPFMEDGVEEEYNGSNGRVGQTARVNSSTLTTISFNVNSKYHSILSYEQTGSFLKKTNKWVMHKPGNSLDTYSWSTHKSAFKTNKVLSSSTDTSKTYSVIPIGTIDNPDDYIQYKDITDTYTDANGNERERVTNPVTFRITANIQNLQEGQTINSVTVSALLDGFYYYTDYDESFETAWTKINKGSTISNGTYTFDVNTDYNIYYHTSDVPTYAEQKNFPSWVNPKPAVSGKSTILDPDSISLIVLRNGWYRYTSDELVKGSSSEFKMTDFIYKTSGDRLAIDKKNVSDMSYTVEFIDSDPTNLYYDNDRAFSNKDGIRSSNQPSWLGIEYVWSSSYISALVSLYDKNEPVSIDSWDDIIAGNGLDTVAFKEYCLLIASTDANATLSKKSSVTDSGYQMYTIKSTNKDVSVENFVPMLSDGYLSVAIVKVLLDNFSAHNAIYNESNLDPNASGTVIYSAKGNGYYKIDNNTVWVYKNPHYKPDEARLLISLYTDNATIYYVPEKTMDELSNSDDSTGLINIVAMFSSTGNPNTILYKAKVAGYYKCNDETDWVYREIGDTILDTVENSSNTVYYLREIDASSLEDPIEVTISIKPRWWIL